MAWQKTLIGDHVIIIKPESGLRDRHNKWAYLFIGKTQIEIRFEPEIPDSFKTQDIIHEELEAMNKLENLDLPHETVLRIEPILARYINANYERKT